MSAETKIEHKTKTPQTFDMTDDDGVPTEAHKEELTAK